MSCGRDQPNIPTRPNTRRLHHRRHLVLDESDLGHRVVVRCRVGSAQRPKYRDLLGQLLAVSANDVVVRTDDGAQRTIPMQEIHIAKRVPPRPPRHSEIIALERVTDRAWPAPVREQLGDWVLRAADGFTSRANSALVLGEPELPLPAAVQACAQWCRAPGLAPRLRVPPPA